MILPILLQKFDLYSHSLILLLITLVHIIKCEEQVNLINSTVKKVTNPNSYHYTTETEPETDNNDCIFNDEEEVENSPWTATLKIHVKNATTAYYGFTIIDKYTVLAYGRPFHYTTNKLAFLPWDSYTVLIGAVKNDNEIKFNQSIGVSYIQPHPHFEGLINAIIWPNVENNYVIIHLNDSIKFNNSTVQSACLPRFNNTVNLTQKLDNLYSGNTTIIIGGWKNYRDFKKTSLSVLLNSSKECKEIFNIKTSGPDFPKKLSYQNRVCGYVSHQNKNNPKDVCITKDSGSLINHGGRYTFVGFVNTWYSVLGKCSKGALFFIFKLDPETYIWINDSLRCGSFNYTCHNGGCTPLNLVCNQKKDGCSDGSDEDPVYCRALNPCTATQFECGVYGACIPKFNAQGKEALNCDGIIDCPLGEDEEFCDDPTKRVLFGAIAGACVCVILITPLILIMWKRIKRNRNWKITPEYFEEFVNGSSQPESESAVENICNRPFDINKYEISKENIEIGDLIGSGNFAVVHKGGLKDHSRACTCAIKIPKPDASTEDVKSLMKEMKIMDYVGKHDNIIEFIGTYTSGLKDGIFNIVLEYCEYGSMENFFKNFKEFFHNECEGHSRGREYVPMLTATKVFNMNDLINWCSQISVGMGHLASKQVVHGDLATRNILIDGNRIAKICDFGLSHHLYRNVYEVSKLSSFPWQWMPPEVLLDFTLSPESDIWSFGVTLWEIFTLGGIPYQSINYHPLLPRLIETNGCPLIKPNLANKKIFQIMRDCWIINPNERPNFEDIEARLKEIIVGELYKIFP